MLMLRGHTDSVRCVAYSPDGRLLASGSDDRTFQLWDIAAGREVFRSPAEVHPASVEALAFSPDGQWLATATAAGSIHLWAVARQSSVWTDQGHRDGVRGLAFTSDGSILVSGSWDGSVIFRSFPSRSQVVQFTIRDFRFITADQAATVVAAAPGTPRIAAGSYDGKITCWEGWDRSAPPLEGHSAAVFGLAFAPDRRTLASGDGQGIIKLWDFEKRKERAELRGHRMAVYSLAFTPDGRTLLSGSADGTVRRWDSLTGQERGAYEWHQRWVTSVAASPDGMTAAAGSADHTIVVWDLEE